MKKNHQVAVLVELGVFVAMAVILDFICGIIYELPYGGSISIAMLPVFVVSYRRGWYNGIIAGALFGLIQCLLKPPFILSIPQFIMDYFLAFMVIGLGGIFKNALSKPLPFSLGIILGSTLRYIVASIAGIIFWAEYIPTEIGFMNNLFGMSLGESAIVVGSLLYNALYMLPSMLLCVVIGLALQNRKILAINLTSEK
ncbi:MAG: energy-coupled thiamine transporter ThiT [Candidatus Izemoplasmatales bacterium]